MIIAGTGHRDDDLIDWNIVALQSGLKMRDKAKVFICGMATGFDLTAGLEAKRQGIEVWAARPWTHHNGGVGWWEQYQEVLDYASKVVVVTEADSYPGAWCMHKRNHWMVDHADVVMAYWSGSLQGGTYQCIKYANSKNKPVANIFNDPPF